MDESRKEGEGISPSLSLDPISVSRVTDTVYQALCDSILNHQLRPGQQLNPKKLAEQLGVSITPVRQAIELLAHDGLTQVIPRKGTFVSTFSAQDLVEIMDIRRTLELLACETAMNVATHADIVRLKTLANRIRSVRSQSRDGQQVDRLHQYVNMAFHQDLVELSGNMRLLSLYKGLKLHIPMLRAHLGTSTWQTRLHEEAEQHSSIISALESGNLVALRKAVEKHCNWGRDALLKDVSSQTAQCAAVSSHHGEVGNEKT